MTEPEKGFGGTIKSFFSDNNNKKYEYCKPL